MDSIKVAVPVNVKARLTEKLRERLVGELNKNIEQLDLELKQIDIERQRELSAHPEHGEQIVRFFGAEANKRQQQKEESLNRKEYLKKLTIGAEILQGTLQHQIELKIGDNLRDIMSVEIITEDDKIVAIRG